MNETETIIQGVSSVDNNVVEQTFRKYERLKITDRTPIPPPVVVIRMRGEIISTEGNVTTISGHAKGGKSAFTGVLLAGAIAEGEYDGFPDVEVSPNHGKAVLHFDTEQARHKHQKNLKTILKRVNAETCPENLMSFNIREEEPEKYRAITNEIADAAFRKFNGIHLIVIDGIADYIKDVNDAAESNAIVKYVEDLAIRYATAVIVIVHLNPGTGKERGHLGSQLQRKSESVLSVNNQGEKSCLEPKFLRMAGLSDIPHIEFSYDKQRGYHTWTGIKEPETEQSKANIRLSKLKTVVDRVFAPPSSYGYKDACTRIMEVIDRERGTAKEYFKEMKAQKMIVQGDDDNWRINMEYNAV